MPFKSNYKNINEFRVKCWPEDNGKVVIGFYKTDQDGYESGDTLEFPSIPAALSAIDDLRSSIENLPRLWKEQREYHALRNTSPGS